MGKRPRNDSSESDFEEEDEFSSSDDSDSSSDSSDEDEDESDKNSPALKHFFSKQKRIDTKEVTCVLDRATYIHYFKHM